MTAPLLDVRGLCVSYGRAQVVHDVSIAVTSGALVTVIGSNGAGKTTLLNAIMGLLGAKGHIGFRDAEINSVALESRVKAGLCLVPERRELFADMSVEDNLLLGGFRRTAPNAGKPLRRFLRACRGSRSDASNWPALYPAANGRCWRWDAR